MGIAAINVANNIIKISKEKHIPISLHKLHLLLYIVYTMYAQCTGKPLFSERFLVRAAGPVCPSVEWKFGCYGAHGRIKDYGRDACGSVWMMDPSSDIGSGMKIRHILADIADVYLPKSDRELQDIVCRPENAWNQARSRGQEELDFEQIRQDKLC